jgi:hypothetical protein
VPKTQVLVVQQVFRAKRTNLHEKYDYPPLRSNHPDLTALGQVTAVCCLHLRHLLDWPDFLKIHR